MTLSGRQSSKRRSKLLIFSIGFPLPWISFVSLNFLDPQQKRAGVFWIEKLWIAWPKHHTRDPDRWRSKPCESLRRSRKCLRKSSPTPEASYVVDRSFHILASSRGKESRSEDEGFPWKQSRYFFSSDASYKMKISKIHNIKVLYILFILQFISKKRFLTTTFYKR